MTLPQVSKLLPAANPQPTFWQDGQDEFQNHRTTDQLPAQTDFLIIGAGYAGTATAYHLTKALENSNPKPSITVLEARGVCSGATGRNGGHLRPDYYGHIPTYIRRAGVEAGAELAEFEIAHIPAIKEIIEREGIDCDFTLTRSIDVWCNQDAANAAKEVYDRMVQHNLPYMQDVFFKMGPDAEGISGVKGAKACASFTAGTMWPYKFIAHLLKAMVTAGSINLQTNTPVTSISPAADEGFIVETPRGPIRAKKVIHASNAYAAGLLPEYSKNIIPCKGICCRITVPEGTTAPLLNNSYINRTEDKVLSYLIPRADGSIIVGGAAALFQPHREQWYGNVDDSVLIEAAKDFYNGYMQRTYRGWEDSGASIDKIWTGVMGYSYDSNAHVGPVPDRPGQYIIAGFNGHGMPVIWLSAKGLVKMLTENASFKETGVPRLFESTKERIERAQALKEEVGDIVGDGTLGMLN